MGKVKVLPVYPSSPPSFWSFNEALKIEGKKAAMPPTGLVTAMAMFPEEEFEIMPVQDLNIAPLDERALKESDLVATSSMVIHEKSHNKVMDLAHRYEKKVVAGGPFPSSSPDRNTRADYIVAGEAEMTLAPFLHDFLKGTPRRIYTEQDAARTTLTKLTRSGKPDLSQTPLPRWDLIDMKAYDSVGIQFSRGCPWDCEFCNITSLFGREARTKGVDQMIAEFQSIYDAGHRGGVFLLDDNLIGNRKNVKQLLPALAKWQKARGYPYDIGTEASMNLAWTENEGILNGMNDAGFVRTFLGIESVDPEVISGMNKQQNLKMSPIEAVRRIQNAGLEVTAGLIIGNDGEKPQVFDDLYNFVQEAGIVLPMAGLLGVVPGTKLATRLEKEGRLREYNCGSNTHSFSLDFEPKLAPGFTEGQLLSGYKDLLQRLFSPKSYYDRCRVLQKELGPSHQEKHSALESMAILGRFAKHQLTGGANLETAKYLAETAARSPSQLTVAVTHTVKYQHLKSITQQSLAADNYHSQLESMYTDFVAGAGEVATKYGENIRSARRALFRKASRVLTKAEKLYERIHPSLRTEAHKHKLRELKKSVSEKAA